VPQPDDPKGNVAAFYSHVAATYLEQGPPRFPYAGRRLVEVVGVGRGDSVLDVATGRGAALVPAAERVGPRGRAVGIDLAPGMVDHTRAALAESGLGQASVQLMDAERLLFPDKSFTHVLCSFAVFFFADLERVLAEIWRVSRDGGVVGFAFQRGIDPRWSWYEELLRAYGALDYLPPWPADGGIRRDGALVAALEAAGFDQAREQIEDVELMYRDAETWWTSLWTHGSRLALEQLAPELSDRLRGECLQRAGSLVNADGLPEQHRFVFVTARRGA